MTNLVTSFIDYFYPPFKKFLNLQTFRYIICGGTNTFLDIVIYFISYNFILQKQVFFLGPVAVKPHVMAFLMSFVISFPTGFYLNRYVVFTGSILKGRVQLFRYLLLVIICVILNYVFIKLFVEQFDIYPTVAKIFTTFIVVTFSYVTQRYFTFKKS